jgi:hypothetical protein
MQTSKKTTTVWLFGLFILLSCSKSTDQNILADEAFFPEGLAKLAEDRLANCPAELKAAEKEGGRLNPGAKVASVSVSYSVDLPEQYRPALGDIEKKYGKPDREAEGVRYYGDIGLKAEEGKVVAVVFTCGRKP